MDIGDLTGWLAALIAMGAAMIAIWSASSAEKQAQSAAKQASEAEKSRAAAERQAEAAERALNLARQQLSNELDQQYHSANERAHNAIVQYATSIMRHGGSLKQAAHYMRDGIHNTRAAQNIHQVADGLASLTQQMMTVPQNENYSVSMLALVEETAKLHDGIRALNPIDRVTHDRIEALGELCSKGSTRILQAVLQDSINCTGPEAKGQS